MRAPLGRDRAESLAVPPKPSALVASPQTSMPFAIGRERAESLAVPRNSLPGASPEAMPFASTMRIRSDSLAPRVRAFSTTADESASAMAAALARGSAGAFAAASMMSRKRARSDSISSVGSGSRGRSGSIDDLMRAADARREDAPSLDPLRDRADPDFQVEEYDANFFAGGGRRRQRVHSFDAGNGRDRGISHSDGSGSAAALDGSRWEEFNIRNVGGNERMPAMDIDGLTNDVGSMHGRPRAPSEIGGGGLDPLMDGGWEKNHRLRAGSNVSNTDGWGGYASYGAGSRSSRSRASSITSYGEGGELAREHLADGGGSRARSDSVASFGFGFNHIQDVMGSFDSNEGALEGSVGGSSAGEMRSRARSRSGSFASGGRLTPVTHLINDAEEEFEQGYDDNSFDDVSGSDDDADEERLLRARTGPTSRSKAGTSKSARTSRPPRARQVSEEEVSARRMRAAAAVEYGSRHATPHDRELFAERKRRARQARMVRVGRAPAYSQRTGSQRGRARGRGRGRIDSGYRHHDHHDHTSSARSGLANRVRHHGSGKGRIRERSRVSSSHSSSHHSSSHHSSSHHSSSHHSSSHHSGRHSGHTANATSRKTLIKHGGMHILTTEAAEAMRSFNILDVKPRSVEKVIATLRRSSQEPIPHFLTSIDLSSERKERVDRFHHRRANSNWTKKVKYNVRKDFADSRLRVKGRFLPKADERYLLEVIITTGIFEGALYDAYMGDAPATEGRVLGGGWVAYHDATYDREYFYHAATQERSWTPPDPSKLGIKTVAAVTVAAEAPKWEAKVDPKTKRTYYVNRATKKSVWKKPADFIEEVAVEVESEVEVEAEEADAAASAAAAAAVEEPVVAAAGAAVSKWTAEVDPATQNTYYVNIETQQSVWERPADYVDLDSGGAAATKTSDASSFGEALDDVWSSADTSSASKKGESAALRVFARFRPASVAGEQAAMLFDENKVTVEIVRHGANAKFTFDRVFQNAAQTEVQAAIGAPAVREVLRGFNSTIFAYGQTGSGKTFSMFGPAMDDGTWTPDPTTAGIIPRATQLLFRQIGRAPAGTEFVIKVSMLEIYNETVNDLLDSTRKNLSVRETKRAGVWVDKLSEECVTSPAEVYRFIQLGSRSRSIASTKMNSESSRSHVVMTLTIEQRKADGAKVSAKLNLVDLAGSENVKQTGAVGKTFDEGKKINLSLTILGQCMQRLSSGGGAKGQHVPFRNSKLTHLLKESLGGNTKTFLLIAARSDAEFITDTTSTLRFGQRAKRIKTQVTAKTVVGVGGLTRELSALKKKLASMEAENKSLLKKVAHVTGGGGSSSGGTKGLIAHWQGKADTASASSTVEQLKHRIVDLEGQLRIAQKQQRESGDAQIAELRVELDGLTHANTELTSELSALKTNLGEAERYGEDLLSQLNDSEKTRAKAKGELALAQASGESISSAMAELQLRVASAEASAAESLRALEETNRKAIESSEASETSAKQLGLHKKWIEEARVKFAAESTRAKELHVKIAKETSRCEALQRAKSESEATVTQLREQMALVQSELQSSREDVDGMQRQIDATAAELQRTAQRMGEKAASAEQRAAVAAAGASSSGARLEQQMQRAAAAEGTLKEERLRYEALAVKQTAVEAASARAAEVAALRLRQEAAARAAESSASADAVRALEQRTAVLSDALEEVTEMKVAAEAYSTGVEAQLEATEKRMVELQSSLQETSATAQLSATGHETLRAKLAQSAAAAAAAQTQAAQSSRALEAEVAARHAAATRSAHFEGQLKEQLAWAEKAQSHVAEQAAAAAASEAALQSDLSAQREGWRKAQGELERAELEVHRATEALASSTATVTDLEARNVDLEGALEKLSTTASAATQEGEVAASVAAERSQELLRQEAEHQHTAAALQTAEAESALKNAELQKKTTALARLQNFVKQQRLQKEQAEASLVAARAESEALRVELDAEKRAVEAAVAETEAAMGEGESDRQTVEELKLEVEALQASEAQQGAYMESMQTQLTEGEVRNSELRAKLERIEVEVRDAEEIKEAMAAAAASGDGNEAMAGVEAARQAAERRAQAAEFGKEELRRSLDEAQMHAQKSAVNIERMEKQLEKGKNHAMDLQQQLLSIHQVYKLQQEADAEAAHHRQNEAASLELARRIHATPSPRSAAPAMGAAAAAPRTPRVSALAASAPPPPPSASPAPAPPLSRSTAAAAEAEYQRDLDIARSLALEETYHAGQLLKLSTKDQWQPRWLVLRGDILDYYHKQTDRRKRGSFALTAGSSVAKAGAADIALKLDGAAPLRLRAKDTHEQAQWFDALQRAITHANPAPAAASGKPKIVRSVSSGAVDLDESADMFTPSPPPPPADGGELPSATSTGRKARRGLNFRGGGGAKKDSPSISTHTGVAGAEPGDYVDLEQLHLTATASSAHSLRSFSCTRRRARRLSLLGKKKAPSAGADEHALVITNNPPRLLVLKFGAESSADGGGGGADAASSPGRGGAARRGRGKVKGAVLLTTLGGVDEVATKGERETQITLRGDAMDGYKGGALSFVLTDGSVADDVLNAIRLALPDRARSAAAASAARGRNRRPSASPALITAAPVATQFLRVAIPAGATAGTTLKIQAPNGAQLLIKVPAGVVPGQMIKVRVPSAAPTALTTPYAPPPQYSPPPMSTPTPQPSQQQASSSASGFPSVPSSGGGGRDVTAEQDTRWDALVGQAMEMGFEFDQITATVVTMRAEGVAPSVEGLIHRLM